MHTAVDKDIVAESLKDVCRITPDVVKEATHHLKPKKNDPEFNFTSDCLKIAPYIFFERLCSIFRFFLIHGHVSEILTLSTLVPLIKDKLGNLCSSDNYRSIAISSLILKIFDWVVILLWGDRLSLDDLQYGYQQNCSTNMCTWMAIETIDHFMRNGSTVYSCLMDLKKAFDTVRHSTLFKKLMERRIPTIYIRLLMELYSKQNANVKRNGTFSNLFSIKWSEARPCSLSNIFLHLH